VALADDLTRVASRSATPFPAPACHFAGDKTLKLHDPSLCAYDLPVIAVGASANSAMRSPRWLETVIS